MNQKALTLIRQRRRQILVHSFLYYQLDTSIITDHKFDAFCNELVDLQKKYPEESKAVEYYDDFKDFDGSSGYDLPFATPDVQNAGYHILETHRRNYR
jgi:NAD-dependent DNA ligase adenylation domain